MPNIRCSSFFLTLTSMAIVYTNVIESPCNDTEVQLSRLINQTLNSTELPSDLLAFLTNMDHRNVSIKVQNCSDFLTLKRFLYNYSTTSSGSELQKRYFSTLYAYVEFKHTILSESKYVPKNHSDALVLINSFSSSNLSPTLGKQIYNYFSHYGNWIDTLIRSDFPFDRYTNPRDLLLGMVCTLIQESAYSFYEREALMFLLANNYTCPLFRDSHRFKWPIEEGTSEEMDMDVVKQLISSALLTKLRNESTDNLNANGSPYMIKLPMLDLANGPALENGTFNLAALEKHLKVNSSGTAFSKDTFLGFVNNSAFEPRIFFNSSVINVISLKKLYNGSTTGPKYVVQNTSATASSDNLTKLVFSATTNQTTTLIEDANTSKMGSPSELLANESSSRSLGSVSEENPTITTKSVFSFSQYSTTEEYLQHEDNKEMLTMNAWDVVEMDGPCKEGQHYLVKLNVQALLTAIDRSVSNASLDLFRKLLPTIKQFPIQDYNARGELLRDLIPAISKQQADPSVRRRIEEILDHVILDASGALPPKVKLECANVTESDLEGKRRRTKRVFRVEYN